MKENVKMLDDYLDKPAIVKLVTGEDLPEGVRFYGFSSLSQTMLWFGQPRASNPHEPETEFHVPISSIAVLIIKK